MSDARTTDSASDTSRREFLRSVGRWLAGGLLAGGMGWLMRRNGVECRYQGACGICPQVHDCSDERAVAVREELGKGRAWKTPRKS